ncbi:MAG: DUF433 domain-containing protein [Bacteroidia bacterium]|nr:DUF433 domain-containing protein [Bacteroidia bacterium]
MDTLEKIKVLLTSMKHSEKIQLLQWIVSDISDSFPNIESNENICGGEPCIVRTRIPVWILVQARRLGASEADILKCYPSLRSDDLVSAWNYCRSHKNEIYKQIRENEKA